MHSTEIKSIVGRLAPSPTGALHLGNARSFLLAWLSVRQQRGRLILRVEDIDSPRVKPWARQATLDDLKWLGLDWDEGPDIGGPNAPYVQTERIDSYRQVLERLIAAERVYPCDCSRSEIAAAASAPHESIDGPIYSGACRHRLAADAVSLEPSSFAWRFRAGNQVRSWSDIVAGPQACNIAQALGDFIVAKGDGTPAYQLAVVVDDHAMGVNEVVRGRDLVPSTFRQLELLEQLNWPRPNYLHVPLIVGSDGRRLAKRHGDTRISWFRQAGFEPQQIWGYLAWTVGLIEHPRWIELDELVPLWNAEHIGNEPTVFELMAGVEVMRKLGNNNPMR